MLITKWPGIEKAPKDFLLKLIHGAKIRGWDYDALLGHISSESKFDPSIRNSQPGQSATGLIQVINQTARNLGFKDAREIGALSFNDQLDKVIFPYFEKTGGGKTLQGADFKVLGFSGNPNLIGGSDNIILYDDPKVVSLNSFVDMDGDGKISLGDVRAFWRAFSRQHTRKLDISELSETSLKKKINQT